MIASFHLLAPAIIPTQGELQRVKGGAGAMTVPMLKSPTSQGQGRANVRLPESGRC
jgi:hypothetical protein